MNLLEACPDVLTVQEAAELLKMSTSTMQGLIDSQQVEQIVVAGRPLIFKPFLLSFIENERQKQYTKKEPNGPPVNLAEPPHLDNCKQPDSTPCLEGDTNMAKKINQPVIINGTKHWITAGSIQEFTDKVIKLAGASQRTGSHLFSAYAWNWFNTYSKPNIETATATTYQRQLTLHILPAFDGLAVESITTDDVQRLFNGINGAKATKDKVRIVLNQILDAAVEDGLIHTNPLKSRRVKITGGASKSTPPYTVEQMRFLVQHIGDVKRQDDRVFLVLLIFHPLRLEEVLGLKGSDIDSVNMEISVRRAVTHPTRNQPEVKETKTDSSRRKIGLSTLALQHLFPVPPDDYILGGDNPLSYTHVRRMCNRIKKDTGFSENITPIRFRTTVLTDLYDQTKDIKLAQEAAGHTTSAMTLKYYVKGREASASATAAVERAYTR